MEYEAEIENSINIDALASALAQSSMDETSTGPGPGLLFGENGHIEVEFEDEILKLFFSLNRGIPAEVVRASVKTIFANARQTRNVKAVRDLCLLAFQTRSCRGGKGERACFQAMMYSIWLEAPQIVLACLSSIPKYGYWKDLLYLLEYFHSQNKTLRPYNGTGDEIDEQDDREAKYKALEQAVYSLYARQLREDYAAEEGTEISLGAKYAPTEGGQFSKTMHADKKMSSVIFGGQAPEHLKQYRKLLTKLRSRLNIVETKMCNKKWKEIQVASICSRAMNIYKSAMLMEGQNKKIADDEDRIQCRDNVANYLKNGGGLHGTQVYPHELVREALKMGFGSTKDTETMEQIVNAQWGNLRAGVEAENSHQKNAFVPMCDVSGSMTGIPMEVSIGLGILLSELQNNSVFKDRVLTFTDTPEWHMLDPEHSFTKKVQSLRTGNWGFNTNFYKALKRILDLCKQCTEPDFQVPNLLVISDMQFDAALDGSEESEWNTAMENVENDFAAAGLAVPTVVFWNVNSKAVGMPAEHECKGVIYMAGFSPALIKFLLSGDLECECSGPGAQKTKMTANDMLRRVLDDAHLDGVREQLESLDDYSLLRI